MSMLQRILRLCKADLHGMMDRLEDKTLLLNQYLREMEEELSAKRLRHREIEKSTSQLEQELKKRVEEIDRLEDDLSLAVSKQKDDIARMLIKKQRLLQNQSSNLEHQLHQTQSEADDLFAKIEEQQLRHNAMKVKAERLRMQYRTQGEKRFETDRDRDVFCMEESEVELELMRRKDQLRHTQQAGGLS